MLTAVWYDRASYLDILLDGAQFFSSQSHTPFAPKSSADYSPDPVEQDEPVSCAHFYLTSDLSSLAVRARVRLNSRTLFVSCSYCRSLDVVNFIRFWSNSPAPPLRKCGIRSTSCANFAVTRVRMIRTGSTGRLVYVCSPTTPYTLSTGVWFVVQLCVLPLARDSSCPRGQNASTGCEWTATTTDFATAIYPSVSLLLSRGESA